MRYRMINNYFDVVFANPGVYDYDDVKTVTQSYEYRISKDLVLFLAHDSHHSYYFIPETHPLFNYGLDGTRNSDEELNVRTAKVIIKQLLSIIEK